MSLITNIDKALKKHRLRPISEIINNKDSCIDYINDLLVSDKNYVEITKKGLKSELDYRVKHTLFSFGLGVYLASFRGMKVKITDKYKKYSRYPNKVTFINVWLSACLYHDYGYFIADDFKGCNTLDKVEVETEIFRYSSFFDNVGFTGKPTMSLENKSSYFDYKQVNRPTSRYSKDLYYAYYEKAYNRHMKNNDDPEIGDHGILGGYVLFDRLCKNLDRELLIRTLNPNKEIKGKSITSIFMPIRGMKSYYKEFCYTIMEHNIWRVDESDNRYPEAVWDEIRGTNFEKINDLDEPLLFLLSLVDTIEFIKKYCVYKDIDTLKRESMYPTTVCKYIRIDVTKTKISFSVNGLNNQLKYRNINKTDAVWKESILSLINWVDVNTKQTSVLFDEDKTDYTGVELF